MNELFKWLSENNIASIALILILLLIVSIYVIAFFQGREISFWPPKIGSKPNKIENKEENESFENNKLNSFGPIQKGSIVEGVSGKKYKIESNFYGGAAATLFKAINLPQDKVIIKLYWRGLRPSSSAWELFNREYRANEILVHRNIVKVLDRGLFSGYPFVVMEYLSGGTLRDLLDSHITIPGKEMLSIVGQIADAIDFAHSNGIIHNDIKPGNILFESNSNGRVAISDFGIAQILGAVEYAITAPSGGLRLADKL
jgi:serine/threonine protein kinase